MSKSIYEVIETANKEHKAAIEKLKADKVKAEADKAKAEERASNAINNGNADEYTKAKEAERMAADKVEFYGIQIKKAESSPLFDNPAERKAKADEIKRDYEAFKADKLKTAAQLIKDAAALIEDVRSEVFKSNDALTILQTNTGKNGGKIDVIIINGLWQRVTSALDHGELKPYV